MKITVIGLGYVGLANSLLLAPLHEVHSVDLDENRVETIARRESPLVDAEIESRLADPGVNIGPTTDLASALPGSDFAVIATPTNYDEVSNYFDTSSVEKVLEQINEIDPSVTAVIKSTIPVGFTQSIRARFPDLTIHFSPEFLREGRALHDNLYPSRVIVSNETPEGEQFAELLARSAMDEDVEVILCRSTEAEAVKLFSNTYLAMRVAFFNELDSFAIARGLDASSILRGVSGDPRIGNYYNNPSFGYGGYCLPKDTKQLLANYKDDIPQSLISATIESNSHRKMFIAQKIKDLRPEVVGIFKLAMKMGSDNSRESAIFDVIRSLKEDGVRVVVFEPAADVSDEVEQIDDLKRFKKVSDVIVCNRYASELDDVNDKVWTRDAFGRD